MSVIIVGGGMAGATLALTISQFSHGTLPVHLIEAKAPEADGHPALTPERLRWRRALASNWRELASGRRFPIAQRQSTPYTSAIAVMPDL
ncbi:2-octaprenyl-6-methoxyphenol hydroxylase [Salmonella enterica subsp. enterica]|uniref:2-octaprenyl-6-methoxyphenol hydroxylase n=1 Tax=Salmonella enterica I TaxID=59201 RepID=A0A3S4FIL5_SALET|nr:2-octaprenyl-6-methoxyphenol hydroxylase [Salmonella enterica subsp. enterica]